uniref:SF1B family DNA helicase RecD2 n=1 Tax=Faecalibacterium sp. TaxID=1971605 RepID=UPI003FED4D00
MGSTSSSATLRSCSTARRIVDRFGTETLDILEREPERLSLIKGITERKAMEIAESFRHHMGLRRLMEFLARYQLPPVLAMQLRRQYGDAALEKVRENLYLLSGESCGVEFAVTDQIALSLGMELDSLCRVEAAVSFELGHNERNGHVFLPREKLIAATAELLHGSADTVEQALDGLIERGAVVQEGVGNAQACYLRRLWEAEQSACIRLTGLLAVEADRSTQPERAVREIESLQGITYAPLQRQAVELAAREGVVILTGGPGTGKTTTVNAILQLLEHQADRVALCAPTGRAAKRLSELTGRKASTIHRLLEVDYSGGVVSFIHNDKNLLKCDVVILDEMSMVDVKLFQALIAALRYSCRIIMVGDADQLPSVGPGNILGEVIRSGLVPTVCLNEIFRQARRSLIVENAHHIISSEPLQKGGKTDDFFFLESDGDAAQKLVCDLVTTRLPRSYGFDPVRDIQVLCPTKLGPTGTQALNVELQNLLNPEQKGKPQLQSASRVFRVGDKVMQVRNNYEIVWNRIGGEQGVGAYNGDIGIVESINMRDRSMVVRMDDRRLLYPAENLNELEIAYAITVHKSQGSEFPAVVLPVAQVPPRLCYRNLFYTGVTRARKLCIVAGRRDVVNRMMSNVRQNLRYSGLCELLKENLPPEQMAAK